MMMSWGPGRRGVYGAVRAVGLGLIAGGFEAAGQAATLKLPLGFGGFLALGLCSAVVMGALALALGLLSAPLVHVALARSPASRAIAAHLGVVGALLCGFYLWQGAAALVAEGRAPAAAVMAFTPLAFGGVVFFNAKFWVRRVELEADIAVGWLPLSALAGLLFAGGGAAVYAGRNTGGATALEDEKNAVIITIDGLSREDVAAYGGAVVTPRLDALAAEGVRFADAVTPSPVGSAANATVMTGLHPLRHEVLRPGDPLGAGFTTMAELLEQEGYATGAFVSDRALGARRGFAQGFRTFDDAIAAPVPGLWHLVLPSLFAGAAPQVRSPAETVAACDAWLDAHADVPFFAWVHLVGGDPSAIDAAVGDVLAAVDRHGLRDGTVVIVAGTHGGGADLSDAAVRVPLIVRIPGAKTPVRVVEPQVRLMDVAPTLLVGLGFDPRDESEGVELLGYAEGRRSLAMWTSLVGFDAGGAPLLGLRNNGVKYVRELSGGREVLYDVTSPGGEARDLSTSQPALLEQARGLVAPEAAAFERLL